MPLGINMRMIYYIILLSILFGFGCAGVDGSAWTVKDSWYNAPKEKNLVPWNWAEKEFYETKQATQKEAQALLEKRQIVKISIGQLNYFAKQQVQAVENYAFYIVRGVFLNEETGGFSIFIEGKRLWVYHGSLGHFPVPMKRKALIVSLDQMPDEVFVTCMMDE